MAIIRLKRFWIAIIIIIGLFNLRVYPYLITPVLIGIVFFYNAKTVQPLKNYKFWIVIFLLVLIVPLFSGAQDRSLLGIGYSSEQLQKTTFMTLRGILVFLLFQVLTVNLDIDKIKPIFSKIGIRNFDVLYSLSNEIFPKIKSILNARYTQYKISWKKDRSIEVAINFFIDIFTDFLLLSEQLSKNEIVSDLSTPNDFLKDNDLTNYPAIYIIVGDAGIGKTPWIEKLIRLLQNNGQTADGLISKKHVKSDDNWQHDLIRISTNEKHPLTTMDEIETNTRVGKFHFYDDVIKWGNKQLISISNTDLLIIDEIGLLEFDGKGFLPGLKHISSNFNGNLIITIRSTMQKYFDEFIEEELPEINSWYKKYIFLN